MTDAPGLPIRRTSAGDFIDHGTGLGAVGQCYGVRLAAAGAAATAQIVDQDGTVLYDLACQAGTTDECLLPVRYVRKIALGTLTGAGAAVTVYIA